MSGSPAMAFSTSTTPDNRHAPSALFATMMFAVWKSPWQSTGIVYPSRQARLLGDFTLDTVGQRRISAVTSKLAQLFPSRRHAASPGARKLGRYPGARL